MEPMASYLVARPANLPPICGVTIATKAPRKILILLLLLQSLFKIPALYDRKNISAFRTTLYQYYKICTKFILAAHPDPIAPRI